MPDRHWPPRPRAAARALQASAYGWSVVAGADVIVGSPKGAPWWAVALGFMVAGGGIVAAVATLRGTWKTEWRAAWLVVTAFACYGAIDLSRLLFDGGGDWGTVALIGVATGWAGRRVVELYIFYLQTTHARTAVGDKS